MAFNRNSARKNYGNAGNNNGSGYGRNQNPWEPANSFRGNEALVLANNLISNLLRTHNTTPPSLLDMSTRGRYDNFGYNYGRANPRASLPVRNTENRRSGRGIKKPDSKNRSKNILAKTNSNSNSDSQQKEDGSQTNKPIEEKDMKDDGRSSVYANIPNDMFYCHLCSKHMWDALSFENHLKGRTHMMMKEGIEESYCLKANMIRQEAKIAEQLKAIEIDRLKRLGKTIRASHQHREYCIMCDLHFYGHLSTHRKSDGHLSLKKFLHPKCNDCNTEFHNRSEYDQHLLSPSHLRNCKTKPASKSEERKRNQLHILKEADEVQGLREPNKKTQVKKKNDSEKSEEATENAQVAEIDDGDEEDSPQVMEETADVILDFIEGVTEIDADIETKLPKYNHIRPVGASMIHKLECFECRLCNKFLDLEKTAEIHSRTTSHHRNFLKFLNEKANECKIAQKRAIAALEESERKRLKTESESKENGSSSCKLSNDTECNELYDPTDANTDENEEEEEEAESENTDKQ